MNCTHPHPQREEIRDTHAEVGYDRTHDVISCAVCGGVWIDAEWAEEIAAIAAEGENE